MEPGHHDIPSHRQGTSWQYEFDFIDLGGDYLEDLVEAQFWTREGSKTGALGLNLSLTGAGDSEAAITVDGTVLRIAPADPPALNPAHHFWGTRLVWEDGREVEPLEGRWTITRSGAPTL
jgi:hypothetical protein